MSAEPLGCLLDLIWLPYRFWQAMTRESRVGTSEMDRQAGRFWKGFAIFATIGTIVILAAVVVWIWLTLN